MSQVYSGASRSRAINISASGLNEVIPAPQAGYLVIDHINLLPASAVNLTMQSGAVALTGTYPLGSKQSIALDNTSCQEDGILTCAKDTAFNINLGSAVSVVGYVKYRVVGFS